MQSQKAKNHIILPVIKALWEQRKFEVEKNWKGKKISLKNYLKLAKESQTYEVLKSTLLNKSICRKDIAEGEKPFKQFSDISRKWFIYWSKG